ncbi:hypothetical protein pipiens_003308 [Culex pipiens pipiens]|uniref:Uncharacterized protein n=1 Tax=Culex pipiens pipiens TaxID=38569 RepID=A0ABD1D090_CULPP
MRRLLNLSLEDKRRFLESFDYVLTDCDAVAKYSVSSTHPIQETKPGSENFASEKRPNRHNICLRSLCKLPYSFEACLFSCLIRSCNQPHHHHE